jgi:hypothetical protein
MSTYTIRPNSVARQGLATSPSGAATVLSYLSDNSDSTVVVNTSNQVNSWVFGLATPTIPSTEFVAACGTTLRWKGNAGGNYTIGAAIYRAADAEPTALNTLYPNNSSVFTTTEVGVTPVSWSLADMASLRFKWYDGRASAAWPITTHADVWSTVYTITKSTAVPQNKTETQSVVPAIQVQLTNTLGWESAVSSENNIRKVLVQTRIESGGTGPGTGTLVATGTTTTTVNATGTVTLNQLVSDFIPNGTYNVYSRAHRYRYDPIVRDEQFSAWSAAATLTMNVPVPNTPTVTLATDQALDRVSITVTPITTSGYADPYIYIERSDDNQQTWVPVRDASGVQGTFGVAQTFYDYESPRAETVFYRAKVESTLSGVVVNASAYSVPQSSLITADAWNFKDVDQPGLNVIDVRVTGNPSEQVTEEQGVFRPLGRKFPVVVSGAVSGWDGALNITTVSELEWERIKYLAESQQVLYLESAFGWSKFIRILSGVTANMSGTRTTPKREVSLRYVEVGRPPVIVGQTGSGGAIPAVIDGGSANPSFSFFYDGGNATATSTAFINGGAAA